MGISIWQLAIVAVLFMLLFGRGKIPALMGDVAEGIQSFRKTMSADELSAESRAEGGGERSVASADSSEQGARSEAG